MFFGTRTGKGSVFENDFCQAWWSELCSWNPPEGRRETTSAICSLNSTGIPLHTHAHTHSHTYTHTEGGGGRGGREGDRERETETETKEINKNILKAVSNVPNICRTVREF